VHADGQHPGRRQTEADHHRRGGNGMRHARWPYRKAIMSLPGGQQRALDRIGHRLAAEDPGLGLRFAFFTRLTRHEPMPATEQVPGRLQRFARRAVLLPLIVISLITLVAAGYLIAVRGQACPARPNTAAPGMSPASRAARCPPGSPIKLDVMPVR
jgi:hypothetical protein